MSVTPTKVSAFLSQYAGVARSLGGWTGSALWVTGTTALVLIFPLYLELAREQDMIKFEREQMQLYTSAGYSAAQVQQMHYQGLLGVPAPTPPRAPGFP